MAVKVRVGHSAHGAGNAPMALGVASGYFRDQGLDVEMVEMPRTGDAVKKLFEDELEFAVAGAAPIIHAARAGHDPVIVMSIEGENVFAVVGAKTIKSPQDLRGTTLAISGHREADDTMLRRTLRDWGIDPDKDVKLEVRGSRGNCWAAVVNGEATAMCATIPQPIFARRLGLPVLKDYMETPEKYQAGCIVTRRRYADAHPDVVRGFLRGQLNSLRLFQKDFDAALPHLKARSKIEDLEVLRETQRLFGIAGEHYVPDPEALAGVVRTIESVFGDRIDIDVNKVVDPSFAASLEGQTPPPPYRGPAV